MCVWLVNGAESLTQHCEFKEETAADSIKVIPSKKPSRKMGNKKRREKTSVRYDTGENSGINMAKSESIAGEGGAEYVADKAEGGGEKSLTHPYRVDPDSVHGRDIPVSGQPAISHPVWPGSTYSTDSSFI